MRRIALVLTVLAIAGAPALADPMIAASAPGTDAGPRSAFTGGFEAAEGYSVGTLDDQQGWDIMFEEYGATQPFVQNVNPATGEQHQRNQYDSGFPYSGYPVGGVRSFGMLTGTATLEFDLAISATGGNDYYIEPSDNVSESIVQRIVFMSGGDIAYFDDDGAGNYGYYDSTADWAPGVYKHVKIEWDWTTPSMKLYYDGTLIVEDDYTVGLPTQMDTILTYHKNFSSADGLDESVTYDLDNVVVTPEPTTLALIGLGAFALLRRRS